ncbi:MAG: ATP-dependent Clp protease adaptor ClpS [Myxococcota bacterium]|nr:ATP-dependent Clp protease adaptor ClpS [Myxococcota bacterium]
MGSRQTEFESDVIAEEDISTKKPKPYHVIIHNDHYTTMAFVVMVLETIFHHPEPTATALMQRVHNSGSAVVGTYSREIAETKILETTALARQNGFPLKCTMQPG